MANLPPVPVTGTVISRRSYPYNAFQGEDGREVPGGTSSKVWLFIGDDQDPLPIKGVPLPLPQPGEVVTLLVRERRGEVRYAGPTDRPGGA
jgi:hypothetical protein